MAVPSDFDCSPKAAAIYQPGPNWSQFRGRLSEHLDDVKARLDDGSIAFGAPMTDQAGQPTGGLFVYNDWNIDSIEKLTQRPVCRERRRLLEYLALGHVHEQGYPRRRRTAFVQSLFGISREAM